MKGQAAIMDALIFMLLASGAATLLFFASSLYASSTNSQLTSIYNNEYANNAMIALHYAQDTRGMWFWNEIRGIADTQDAVETYLNGYAREVWTNITSSSPAGERTFLCFEGSIVPYCCGGSTGSVDCHLDRTPSGYERRTTYTSSVRISDVTTAVLKLYY